MKQFLQTLFLKFHWHPFPWDMNMARWKTAWENDLGATCQISLFAICVLKTLWNDNDKHLYVPLEFFFFERWRANKDDFTPNIAVPCPSGWRPVRSCEVMGSVLTSMASVPALMLLGVGESTESTVSSWKTGEETSSCLIGLKEIPQKIHSVAKQKLIYHNTLDPIVKRYTDFKFSYCLLIT